MLNHALKGAASQGAETELVHLYDFNYKGCVSCFACKLKDGKSYGRCALNDDLTSVLYKAEATDAMIFGSPIYFGSVTGILKSFLERLMFQYLVYDVNYSTQKRIPASFIYTMNVNQSQVIELGYEQNINAMEMRMRRIFGTSESLLVTDTYQFDDYSKYIATMFNAEEKAKRRKDEFPKDCQKAFEMGARLARQINVS